jgi:hypothetical protein
MAGAAHADQALVQGSLLLNAAACAALAWGPSMAVTLGRDCGAGSGLRIAVCGCFNRAAALVPGGAGAAMGLVNMVGIVMILVGAPAVGFGRLDRQFRPAFGRSADSLCWRPPRRRRFRSGNESGAIVRSVFSWAGATRWPGVRRAPYTFGEIDARSNRMAALFRARGLQTGTASRLSRQLRRTDRHLSGLRQAGRDLRADQHSVPREGDSPHPRRCGAEGGGRGAGDAGNVALCGAWRNCG